MSKTCNEDSLCLDRRTKEHKHLFCNYVLMSKPCNGYSLCLDRRTKEHKTSFCTYVLMSKTCDREAWRLDKRTKEHKTSFYPSVLMSKPSNKLWIGHEVNSYCNSNLCLHKRGISPHGGGYNQTFGKLGTTCQALNNYISERTPYHDALCHGRAYK